MIAALVHVNYPNVIAAYAPPLRAIVREAQDITTAFCGRLAANLSNVDSVLVTRSIEVLVFMTTNADVDISDPAAFVIADHLDTAIDSADKDEMEACLPLIQSITNAHPHHAGFWHTFGGMMVCRRISKLREALEDVCESAVNADRSDDRIDYAFESKGDR